MAAPLFDAMQPPREALGHGRAAAPDEAPAAARGITAQAALATLSTRFGGPIATSVLQALGHDPEGARRLDAPALDIAAAAAATSRTAISGLNFLSRALLSAERDSAGFRDCVAAAGIPPDTLTPEIRACIDDLFALEMAAADGPDGRCVDLAAAKLLMQRAIGSVLQRAV